MTPEQEAKAREAARNHFNSINPILRGDLCQHSIEQAFKAGAAWSAAQPQWLPIESAPKHVDILMKCKHGAIQGTWDGTVGSGYYWQNMEWFATHWMPLPTPPAQPNEGGGE